MGAFNYNDQAFRTQFTAFANAQTYPEPTLAAYYMAAGYYIENSNYGPLACSGATPFALNLMTAHLAQLGSQIVDGTGSGVVVAAAIDKINVTIQEFQYPNQWQYWLASTEYGKQLLALLQVQSVGGFYVPGGPGRAGFGVN
jgi:hypothetical protein